jgi:hypothetical protein
MHVIKNGYRLVTTGDKKLVTRFSMHHNISESMDKSIMATGTAVGENEVVIWFNCNS